MRAYLALCTSLCFLWLAAPAAAEPLSAEQEALAASLADGSEGGAAVIPGVPPGPAPDAAAADQLTHDISAGLRCPVCQGLSVADSTSPAAVAMQRRVRDFVEAGYERADIDDYFVDKYGEWVLLAPRATGLNQIAWLGPGLALALGGLVLGGVAWTRRRGDTPTAQPTAPGPTSADTAPEDPYAAALLAEVDHD